ncbi:transcriptional regulator [Candidatus Kaiserbacteria bacterium]|nr:MAG: transcriptional regulator [Candidatus Kaiserbacteria bacterium]
MRDQSLTTKLRTVRTNASVTQEQLAESVQVSRQTIISIEKGNYTPSVALAIRIAQHFNVSVETIFAYEK